MLLLNFSLNAVYKIDLLCGPQHAPNFQTGLQLPKAVQRHTVTKIIILTDDSNIFLLPWTVEVISFQWHGNAIFQWQLIWQCLVTMQSGWATKDLYLPLPSNIMILHTQTVNPYKMWLHTYNTYLLFVKLQQSCCSLTINTLKFV